MRRGNEEVWVLEIVRRGWKIPNLQKNRKIQGSDQPARAAAKARSRRSAPRRGSVCCWRSWDRNDRRYRVSRMRCSAEQSGAVHRWSGTATDWNGPRKSGLPDLRAYGRRSRVNPRSVSAAHHFVLRCARDTHEGPTCGCTKWRPGQFHCFGVVIYN